MNEVEFRDWIRAELNGFRGRLDGFEARLPSRSKLTAAAVDLADKLMVEIKAGRVSSLAIVYVCDQGPMTGWSTGGDLLEKLNLIGATEILLGDLLTPEDKLEAERAA